MAAVPSRRFHQAIAKIAEAKPTLLLQQAIALSNIAFRVTAAHAPHRQALSERDYDEMVAAATENKFRLFPDTLEIIGAERGQQIISGIVEANSEVRDFEANKERVRVLAANTFIDDVDNSIWRVVENSGKKFLVQSVKEDYASLIGARLARRAGQVVASANYPGLVPANGDYVQFYHPQGQLAWGFAITAADNKIKVLERDSRQLVDITPAHVVAACDGLSLDKKHSAAHHMLDTSRHANILAAAIEDTALTAYLDYMRNLFGDTDYFRQLEKLIRERRNMINNDGVIHLYQ